MAVITYSAWASLTIGDIVAQWISYNCFAGNAFGGVNDFLGTAGSGANTIKIALTNTAPNVATHTVFADITEITAQHGYSAGGSSLTNVGTSSGGVFTLAGSTVTFTASGGSFGPFRYAVARDSTVSGGPLIAYVDYGSNLTVNDLETFTITINASTVFVATPTT